MNDTPTVERFREDIEAVIARYRASLTMTYAELLGTLFLIMQDIAREEDDEDTYP
ncbi:MAG: hypothetical protein V4636_13015 [Pseudomonadota bacterium]